MSNAAVDHGLAALEQRERARWQGCEEMFS